MAKNQPRSYGSCYKGCYTIQDEIHYIYSHGNERIPWYNTHMEINTSHGTDPGLYHERVGIVSSDVLISMWVLCHRMRSFL